MSNRSDENEQDSERRTAALMGVVVVLSLAIAGVVLVRDLQKEAILENCLMTGRTNCMLIDIPLDPR